jgi:ribosomally synthesized peptide (two-chain TOMM family)
MPSDTDFTAFSVALIAAMAQAWHDEEFRAVLLLDAAKALHTIRGYILPWNFAVVVKDAPRSRWQPRTEHEGPSHWVFEERQVLQLNLPSKPSDLYSEPVALAAYNATGAEYPFSCCT